MKKFNKWVWVLECALFMYWATATGEYTTFESYLYILTLALMVRRCFQVGLIGKRRTEGK